MVGLGSGGDIEAMKLSSLQSAAVAAIALGAGLAVAEPFPRAADVSQDGHCRLRIFVDNKARVDLRGDQIAVLTEGGRRSYDEGSTCNRPLPAYSVMDFRVIAERGRGHIIDERAPHPGNGFTGSIEIADPAPAGDVYVIEVAWRDRDIPARLSQLR
jgi:hypothetical protein